MEKLVPDDYKTDADSGAQLGYQQNAVPSNTRVIVQEETNDAFAQIVVAAEGAAENTMYDIVLEADGEKIQPSGCVLVKLPIPAGYNRNSLRVYYLSPDGAVLLESFIEGDSICFETTHFSVYAIVDVSRQAETPQTQEEPQDEEDVCPYCGRVHAGAWQRLVAFFHRVLYFFAHLLGRM